MDIIKQINIQIMHYLLKLPTHNKPIAKNLYAK